MRWLLFHLLFAAATGGKTADVAIIQIRGAIDPATADYVARAVRVASEDQRECLIIHLDTPGGLLASTKEIVQTFYSSSVPTVVYVSPAGASATSAGTFITLAADVAVMAPNTTIGAAHPVSLGGGGQQQTDKVTTEKVENYATSWIESIAAKRNRNVEWAKAAVQESASITAEEAVRTNVIDLIAADVGELLSKLDGREVRGKALHTASAQVRIIPMIARERVFHLFWRPEVMFILMLVAIYGIIGELSNPGAIFPGVVGVIALILVLYMAAVLPVNVAGLLLILLAVGLFIAEAFTTAFGLLTVGGLVAFFFGALMLFKGETFRLSPIYIIPAAVVTAVFFVFVIGAGLRAQRRPVRVGQETFIGKLTVAVSSINASGGKVSVDGELWQAVSETPVAQGEMVEIVGTKGLTLAVKPTTKRGA
jgi:membrane-bound serine protease (ClpP class)